MESNHAKLKKRPTKVEEMTKEQIRQAITKKRECNAKAQQIVENLLEDSISEAFLLQCLPDINQSHFDDIIEERSITQTCGYPICRRKLKVNDIPKQKYRISLKTNKVYDITVRKNFCSNECYKAAMYVKKQMLTSPLWFREYENIPIFHLLPLDSAGSMGQEVDVAIYEDRAMIQSDRFTSINDFANASLGEMTEDPNTDNNESLITTDHNSNDKPQTTKKDYKNEKENHPIPSKNNIEHEQKNVSENNMKPKANDKKKPTPNPLNIVGEVIEKPERKVDPILLSKPAIKSNEPKKVIQKKQPLVTALIIEVEKCLAQWFTLDTMLFIFGDEKIREMVTDKGEYIKNYLNNYAKGIFYNSNSYDQYQQLCKKLNMLELEDRHCDTQTLQRTMKPLPDYSIIKEESKKMQLKVKAFYSGETEIPEPDPIQETSEQVQPENTTHLPLVDKNAQNALRRRIVCQHIDKVLPDLLRSLGLLTLMISLDVRLLVNTFKLKANNIMFKPIQWTLIAIVFIKLLSIRDRRLEDLLKQPMAYQHMQLLLLSYKQDGGYLDRLISWLTDIDRLLDTDDTQLTL